MHVDALPHTLKPHDKLSKLRTMTKYKDACKELGTSDMRCVELRAENLSSSINMDIIECSSSQVWTTLQ